MFEVLEGCKPMSNGPQLACRVDGYGDYEASHVRQPLKTRVHVLAKETPYRLKEREREREREKERV